MKIYVNDKPVELPDNCSLTEMLDAVGETKAGTAIAVNDAVVPAAKWDSLSLKEGDKVLLIKAAYGG